MQLYGKQTTWPRTDMETTHIDGRHISDSKSMIEK